MDWIAVVLIIIAVVALVGCVLQIIWIRNKLNNYSQTQMAAALNAQNATLSQLAIPQPTAQVYSLLVDSVLTNKINQMSAPEHSALATLAVPQTFNVPQICNNQYYTSGSISCNKVAYLVVNINDSVSQLVITMQHGKIMYVMIKSVLYLAKYDPLFMSAAQSTNMAYNSKYIIALYTILSLDNISNNGTNCSTSIVPFFGSLSTDDTPTITSLLSLSPMGTTTPIHMMAIMLENPHLE